MEWERPRSDLAEGLRRRLARLDVDGVRLVARRRATRRLGLPLALAAVADEYDAADEDSFDEEAEDEEAIEAEEDKEGGGGGRR